MLSLRPVTSSTIEAVSHDGRNLWVLFKTQKLYRYSDVPRDLFEQLMSASSKGKFFGESIKNSFTFIESSEPFRVGPALSLRDLLPGPSFGF
jgi:hypothetical protein